MASIQEEILKQFYARLAEAEGFTEDRVKQLRDLFAAGKKPKAAEIIKVLSEQPEGKLT